MRDFVFEACGVKSFYHINQIGRTIDHFQYNIFLFLCVIIIIIFFLPIEMMYILQAQSGTASNLNRIYFGYYIRFSPFGLQLLLFSQ